MLSLAEFARRRGVSRAAVTQAIRVGRLRFSIDQQEGRPVIADEVLADREWATKPVPRPRRRAAPASAPAKSGPAQQSAPRRMPPPPPPPPRPAPIVEEGVPSVAVSRARFEAARAELAAMEVAEKKGELVSVEKTRAAVAEKFTAVRTRLLGVPTRIKQNLPQLGAEDVRIIDALIREALEELAGGRVPG